MAGKGDWNPALHLGTLVSSVHNLIWKGEAVKKGESQESRRDNRGVGILLIQSYMH